MNELSAFERRLAASLDAYAGPRRSVEAIAIARTAASRAAVRSSILSRFSASIGRVACVRGRRPGDLGVGRGARPLVVLVVIALLAALAFGAIAVGSGLVRLTSVLPPSQTPSPSATTRQTTAQTRPAAWTSAGEVPSSIGRSPFAVTLHDGRVLVVEHSYCSSCKGAAAALYDPAARRWSIASPLPVGGSVTLLVDGTVLVAGGGKSGTAAQL